MGGAIPYHGPEHPELAWIIPLVVGLLAGLAAPRAVAMAIVFLAPLGMAELDGQVLHVIYGETDLLGIALVTWPLTLAGVAAGWLVRRVASGIRAR